MLELLFADDALGHRAVFATALTVIGVLVVGGVRVISVRPWAGAAMASLGAIAGGFALFWTVAAIALAIAIVVLSIIVARRSSASEVQPR